MRAKINHLLQSAFTSLHCVLPVILNAKGAREVITSVASAIAVHRHANWTSAVAAAAAAVAIGGVYLQHNMLMDAIHDDLGHLDEEDDVQEVPHDESDSDNTDGSPLLTSDSSGSGSSSSMSDDSDPSGES